MALKTNKKPFKSILYLTGGNSVGTLNHFVTYILEIRMYSSLTMSLEIIQNRTIPLKMFTDYMVLVAYRLSS